MSETRKSYCSLYTFVKKTNPELYSILDDMCAVGLFRTRHDITFLNPSIKLTEKLIKMIEKDESEKAYNKLKSLFIYGKHEKLNKDVVSYNNKNYSDDLSGLKLLSDFKQWEDNKNVSVFDYKSDDFPKEGENAERPPMKKEKKNGKKGGNESNTKVEFTNELMKKADNDQVTYALNSLLKYVKEQDFNMFNTIKYKIDPNMILSWYIIVQPSKTNPCYIKHELFNTWKLMYTDNIENDTKFIVDTLNKTEPCRKKLEESKGIRATVNEDDTDMNKYIESIKKAYDNNNVCLLEDELRFRYSEVLPTEMFEQYIPTLDGINWIDPEKSLVLVDKCGINLLHNQLFDCLKEFVNSNAFKYTLLNNEICNKLASKAGSGEYGNKNGKKIVKILGTKHREILKNTKSVKTIEIVESLLTHLSKKEKEHIKSLL